MTKQVTVLNRQRGAIKTNIQRLDIFLKDYKETPESYIELTQKLDNVTSVNKKIEQLRYEYCALPDDADIDESLNCMDELQDNIDKIEVRLKFIFSNLKNKNVSLENENKQSAISIKLPEIPLPVFYGNYEDWNVFKNQFYSLIVTNNELNETQKLHYLQASLKGEAKSIQTPDDTFNTLLKTLEQRYENKKLIADSHINSILSLDKITHESSKELRKLTDSILKHLRALKLLDLELNKLSELMLIHVISQKLDRESRKQYELTQHSNELPKWDEFISFLLKRSQVLENIQRNQALIVKTKSETNFRSKSLIIKSNSNQNCPICQNNPHPVYKCKKFHEMSIPDRYNEIKKKYLCFNCFEPHKISECKSKKT